MNLAGPAEIQNSAPRPPVSLAFNYMHLGGAVGGVLFARGHLLLAVIKVQQAHCLLNGLRLQGGLGPAITNIKVNRSTQGKIHTEKEIRNG